MTLDFVPPTLVWPEGRKTLGTPLSCDVIRRDAAPARSGQAQPTYQDRVTRDKPRKARQMSLFSWGHQGATESGGGAGWK